MLTFFVLYYINFYYSSAYFWGAWYPIGVHLKSYRKMAVIKIIGKIDLHLASRLISRLEKAGLTPRLAKEISSSPDNVLAEKMMVPVMANITNIAIRQNSAELKRIKNDKRFQKIAEFKIKILATPSLERFKEKYGQKFSHLDKHLKDINFHPSEPLEVGQEKTVFIYSLHRSPSNRECLKFIKAHGGQLPNAQGLSESYDQGSQYFPHNLFVIGFDEKENLWCDPYTQPLLPILGHNKKGKSHFGLTSFRNKPGDQDCLLFFK